MLRGIGALVLYTVTGAVLFSVFGALTGTKLVISGPRGSDAPMLIVALTISAVVGGVFWTLLQRITGRGPIRSGRGYPITSLARDDLRSQRWLDLFAAALHDEAEQRQAAILSATGRDPGSQFPEALARAVDEVARLYRAGSYDAANKAQKHVANWVTRVGRGEAEQWYSPAEVVAQRAGGDAIMLLWKRLWDVAADPAAIPAPKEREAETVVSGRPS